MAQTMGRRWRRRQEKKEIDRSMLNLGKVGGKKTSKYWVPSFLSMTDKQVGRKGILLSRRRRFLNQENFQKKTRRGRDDANNHDVTGVAIGARSS